MALKRKKVLIGKSIENNMITMNKFILAFILASLSFNTLAQPMNKAITNIQAKPSIIALSPHIVEMLYDIGAGTQIIGTTEYSDYPIAAKGIPRIGNYLGIQIERVIELKPDLIIAWKSGSPSSDLAKLKQLGFTIVYSQPNSFEDLAKEMVKFGELTGNAVQGKAQADNFLLQLKQIKNKYKNTPLITAFYELWSTPLTTIAKSSWPQQYLNICKVHNPFEDVSTPYPQINIEQLLQMNIDIIIQPQSSNQSSKLGFNWQDWPLIPAVKNKNIIHPNADAMHRMTKRSLNELKKLCATVDNIRLRL